MGIDTTKTYEIQHGGELLRLVFYKSKKGNPSVGFVGPKSFDIQRQELTEELMEDMGLDENFTGKQINNLHRRSLPKNRKGFKS